MIANTESFLAVDIGNTHAHFGIINQRKILDQWSVPTSSLGDDLSLWSWQDKLKGKKLSGCCYCSVAPSVNKVFERHLSKIVKKIHHLNCRNIKGIKIQYPKPEEIGQDRLANAVAAKNLYGCPAIVIDMGTAVTFDILSAEGYYEGGIIAPGLSLMTHYLNEKTELLPKIPASEIEVPASVIGKSTVAAMKVGCGLGYAGMIESMLKAVLEELRNSSQEEVSVTLTGGDAGKLLQSNLRVYDYEKSLTLLGLAIEFEHQDLTMVL